jgi:hypothetical protein
MHNHPGLHAELGRLNAVELERAARTRHEVKAARRETREAKPRRAYGLSMAFARLRHL